MTLHPLVVRLKSSEVPSGLELAGGSICLPGIHLGGLLLHVTHACTGLVPGLKGNTWLCCLRGWPKIFFLHRIVSTSVYMEDILHIETVNESL